MILMINIIKTSPILIIWYTLFNLSSWVRYNGITELKNLFSFRRGSSSKWHRLLQIFFHFVMTSLGNHWAWFFTSFIWEYRHTILNSKFLVHAYRDLWTAGKNDAWSWKGSKMPSPNRVRFIMANQPFREMTFVGKIL